MIYKKLPLAAKAIISFFAVVMIALFVGIITSPTPANAQLINGNTFSFWTVTGTTTTSSLVMSTSISPLSNAACTTGRIGWDTGFLYVCTASGAWKRAALTGGY